MSMKRFSLLYGVGLGIVLAVSPANAGNRDFMLINDTRSIIDGVWVSTSDDNIWHATNGFKPLNPGDSTSIVFDVNDASSVCVLQLKVHLQTSDASVEWDKGFDFCQLHKIRVWFNYDTYTYRVTYY
jgi:hypothetical protein